MMNKTNKEDPNVLVSVMLKDWSNKTSSRSSERDTKDRCSKNPETQPECPTEIQRLKEPVGEVIGDERVVEHRLVQNGNSFECITMKR